MSKILQKSRQRKLKFMLFDVEKRYDYALVHI
jgi:hypothetical protein